MPITSSPDLDQPEPLLPVASSRSIAPASATVVEPARRLALRQRRAARDRARDRSAERRHARLPRAEEIARAAQHADRARRSRSRRSCRSSPSAARARPRTAATDTAGSSTTDAGRGRRGRAADAAATARTARRARRSSRVAFGTSTPTSTTVVDTSTCSSPARERLHHALLRVGLHAAVQQPDAVRGKHLLRQVIGHLGRRLQVDLLRLLDQRIDRRTPAGRRRAARARTRRPRRAATRASRSS